MTRFEKEISGQLGEYWKKSAEKELAKVRADLENGKITIDENGVARNCIGRALMDDMREKVSWITDRINIAATAAARDEESRIAAEEYRAYRAEHGYSQKELEEMRAAFGPGETVVDILTGQSWSF